MHYIINLEVASKLFTRRILGLFRPMSLRLAVAESTNEKPSRVSRRALRTVYSSACKQSSKHAIARKIGNVHERDCDRLRSRAPEPLTGLVCVIIGGYIRDRLDHELEWDKIAEESVSLSPCILVSRGL